MATWLGLGLTLTARGIANPKTGAALLRVGWRFRSRDWYRRFPFLPLPARESDVDLRASTKHSLLELQ